MLGTNIRKIIGIKKFFGNFFLETLMSVCYNLKINPHSFKSLVVPP